VVDNHPHGIAADINLPLVRICDMNAFILNDGHIQQKLFHERLHKIALARVEQLYLQGSPARVVLPLLSAPQ
jgi:hypothetical protein